MKSKEKIHPALLLTQEVQDAIIYSLSLGSTFKVASDVVDLHPSTIRGWKKDGKEHFEHGKDTIYSRFYLAIKKANSQRIQRWLKIIDKASEADEKYWPAAAWKLERIEWKTYSSNAAARELAEQLEQFKRDIEKRISSNGKEISTSEKENEQMDSESSTEIS